MPSLTLGQDTPLHTLCFTASTGQRHRFADSGLSACSARSLMSGWLFGRHRQLAKTLLLRLSLAPLNEPKTISYIWVLGVTIQHYESDVLCDPARTSQTLPILVGCIKDCLLYTSDAADERSSVDLGGRRII